MDFLNSIIESIASLPGLIADFIKDIFVPDRQVIEEQFNTTIENIKRIFNLDIDSVTGLFDSMTEQPVTDIKGDYNIPGLGIMNITFLKADYLQQGVDYFRPFIRGFIVFLLLLYNYYQGLTFIGQEPGYGNTKLNEDSKGGKK